MNPRTFKFLFGEVCYYEVAKQLQLHPSINALDLVAVVICRLQQQVFRSSHDQNTPRCNKVPHRTTPSDDGLMTDVSRQYNLDSKWGILNGRIMTKAKCPACGMNHRDTDLGVRLVHGWTMVSLPAVPPDGESFGCL